MEISPDPTKTGSCGFRTGWSRVSEEQSKHRLQCKEAVLSFFLTLAASFSFWWVRLGKQMRWNGSLCRFWLFFFWQASFRWDQMMRIRSPCHGMHISIYMISKWLGSPKLILGLASIDYKITAWDLFSILKLWINLHRNRSPHLTPQ